MIVKISEIAQFTRAMPGSSLVAYISTKVTFWSQEEEQLNSLVNRLLPREAGKNIPI